MKQRVFYEKTTYVDTDTGETWEGADENLIITTIREHRKIIKNEYGQLVCKTLKEVRKHGRKTDQQKLELR